MTTWRLIDKGGLSATDCLTLPTALAKGVAAGAPNTVAIYFPLETFVSIGAEQEVRQAVDLDYCRASKIPVWRRTTGGGALYVDNQQIFYSVAYRLEEPLPNNLDQLYNDWLQPLQRACRQLNVPAQYQQYNRLQLGAYQIAGAVASLVDGVLLFTANLQVNISQEATKSGIDEHDAVSLVKAAGELENIRVKGLMTMPPYYDDPDRARPFFRQLARLAQRIGALNLPGVAMDELSMGMTGDFEVAIEEGATMIRVGRAIFGERHTT